MTTDETLEPTTITADLRTATLPRSIHCYDSVGSTMDLARYLLVGADDRALPALIVADEQTAGRGRLGRPWLAPPGAALLVSLALRPTWLPPARGVALVWMAAVALCEAVESSLPLRAGLKWPNDLLVPVGDLCWRSERASSTPDQVSDDQAAAPPTPDGTEQAASAPAWAKAAGILLEVSSSATAIEWAILGCGVNVHAAPPPTQTRYPATSLAAAAGTPVSRLALLRALLRRLDHWHLRLLAGDSQALFDAWRGRLLTLGQQVRVETPGGPVAGLAEGVDPDGALLVRGADGRLHPVTAGDVGLL